MDITVIALEQEEACTVFRDGADLSDFDESLLSTYVFTNKKKSVLTSIQAGDKIQEFGLTPDLMGQYNPQAYNMAAAVSYMMVYCTGWVKNGVTVTEPTQEQIEALPEEILLNYHRRSAGGADLNKAKKPKPIALPNGGIVGTAPPIE